MAEKAAFLSVSEVIFDGTNFVMVAQFSVTHGVNAVVPIGATAASAVFDPADDPLLYPSWKQLLANQVVAAAWSDYGITVDQVMFPDFSVLSIL